jgi:hypothetical protein
MTQILLTIPDENQNLLVQALSQNGMLAISTGLLVSTDSNDVASLLGSLRGAQVIGDQVQAARLPKLSLEPKARCSKCGKGIARKNGLCTQCRQNQDQAKNTAKLESGINKVVEMARANGTLSAHKVG